MNEAPEPLPLRLVAIAYVLALLCLVAPVVVFGAAFAAAVIIRRGPRLAGAGVLAVALAATAFSAAVR